MPSESSAIFGHVREYGFVPVTPPWGTAGVRRVHATTGA